MQHHATSFGTFPPVLPRLSRRMNEVGVGNEVVSKPHELPGDFESLSGRYGSAVAKSSAISQENPPGDQKPTNAV
ncbi:hypothetical protein GCM10018954_047370 [Kutzneria kofuensis]